MTTLSLPDTCDYLVIGGGATGMAFCDTLLKNSPSLEIVVVDKHGQPGGQWMDSYEFVRLHQPSNMYGVESDALEDDANGSSSEKDHHRATRAQILEYYTRVQQRLTNQYKFHFVGNVAFDMSQLQDDSSSPDNRVYRITQTDAAAAADDDEKASNSRTGALLHVRKQVVDARFLQPDLPVFVKPKFSFDTTAVHCIPVNELAKETEKASKHFVIIGAGKTGMDAVTFLLQQRNIHPQDIRWIMPNDAWITARENMGSCLEFLHTCTQQQQKQKPQQGPSPNKSVMASPDLLQKGFLQWEAEGKVYRMDQDRLPTKFKDATLSKTELELLQTVTVFRNGRIRSIADNGDLCFVNGTTLPLPWPNVQDTTFVHCSAGAFNYTQHPANPPPVFGEHVITIQDVYGTPGFCFVGSVIGKLASLERLSLAEKNDMCLVPHPDPEQARMPLGPSGGDVGTVSSDHGYVQRLSNLRRWLQVPEVREWLVGHRLFNLRHLSIDEICAMVEETWKVLQEGGVVQ